MKESHRKDVRQATVLFGELRRDPCSGVGAARRAQRPVPALPMDGR